MDVNDHRITIKNNGGKNSISGYMLYSSTGKKLFVFPKDAIINNNQEIIITSEENTGDYFWSDKKWNKTKGEIYELYDKYGVLIDMWEK